MFEIIILIYVFIVGLVIGSFLNVVGLRLLKNEDFVFERSKCPKCGAKIAWYDNIPILSFVLLGGKCRNCKEGISFQYPLVEFATAALFTGVYYCWGFSLATLFLFFFVANLIVITITDWKEKLIYDINSVPLIPVGLVYNFFNIGGGSTETVKYLGITFNEVFISALLGALLGATFFEIFSRIGYVFSGEYAFGGGDTILGAAFGAWFGWKAFIIILVLSFLIQMVVGIPIMLSNLLKAKEHITLYAMGGLFMSLLLSIIGRICTYSAHFFIAVGAILCAFAIGIVSVIVIFKRMRETQNYTFLPFGPPLVLAALIYLFAGNNLEITLPF
ncbi:MAG: prepilin peptidase [Candidatus Gastranaerophilales bacterium]|nr:prepilin peptidase [Candidatus Gastranaerophilales bacterium]